MESYVIYYFYKSMEIKLSDATTGAIAFYIKPIIAPFLAILILKEMIMWNTVVGILLLFLASMISLISAKKKLN